MVAITRGRTREIPGYIEGQEAAEAEAVAERQRQSSNPSHNKMIIAVNGAAGTEEIREYLFLVIGEY